MMSIKFGYSFQITSSEGILSTFLQNKWPYFGGFILRVREMVLRLAPRRCDAVESATQKENGGVLCRSPKNKKILTATLC